MTNSRMITWGLWAIVVLAMTIITACGNNGITAPNSTNTKDFGWGPGPGDEDYAALMDEYDLLKAAGGGINQVDAGNHTLIATFDRWTGTAVPTLVNITDANGLIITFHCSGLTFAGDLNYPIIATVIADGYIAQTLVGTQANCLVFGMEHVSYGFDEVLLYGVDTPGLGEIGLSQVWRTKAMNTQGSLLLEEVTGGGSTPPYTILRANPWRPTGAVIFKYLFPDDAPPVSGSQVVEGGEFEIAGYAYDDLSNFFPGEIGTWQIDFQDVTELNEYDPGNYSFMAMGIDGDLNVTGGTTLANTCEFVPCTLPSLVTSENGIGTYTLQGVEPVAVGDRDAVRAKVTYLSIGSGGAGSETVFEEWDPAGTTLPDLTFSVLPEVDEAVYVPVHNYINASWTNDSSEGLLVLKFGTPDQSDPKWIVYVDSSADALPEDSLIIAPTIMNLITKLRVTLSRVTCAGIDIDNFDSDTVWGNVTSIADSRPAVVTPSITPQY